MWTPLKSLKVRASNPNIDFKVQLNITAYDREVENQCREYKSDGKIDSYRRDFISGKISVCKNGRKRTINSDADLLIYWLDDNEIANVSTESEESAMYY